jgi:hypothetical protein
MARRGKLLLPHIFEQIIPHVTLWAAGVDAGHVLREIRNKVPLLDCPLSKLIPGQFAIDPSLGERMGAAVAASHGLFKLNAKIRCGHRMLSPLLVNVKA